MTIESYVKNVLAQNPDFAQQMNERVATEFAVQIAETKATYASRIEASREAWCANRGEEAYEANKESIAQHIAIDIPRYAYIKRIRLNDDTFDVQIDLLDGTWQIVPV